MRALFIGIFPTGFGYADSTKEEHGDYKRIAHLSFETLELTVYAPKSKLLPEILSHVDSIRRRAGQEYVVSGSGQTVMLGWGAKPPACIACGKRSAHQGRLCCRG